MTVITERMNFWRHMRWAVGLVLLLALAGAVSIVLTVEADTRRVVKQEHLLERDKALRLVATAKLGVREARALAQAKCDSLNRSHAFDYTVPAPKGIVFVRDDGYFFPTSLVQARSPCIWKYEYLNQGYFVDRETGNVTWTLGWSKDEPEKIYLPDAYALYEKSWP
jgi:hypothetical protein